MQRFEYICFHNTDSGFKIDEFTLFANVISRTEGTVTYKRFQKFGKIPWEKPVTTSVEKFDHYYQPLAEELYQQCVAAEAASIN